MDDILVAFCGECGTDQPRQYMERSPVFMGGDGSYNTPSCKFCGGVVIVSAREDREIAYKQFSRERGHIIND